MKTKTKKPSLRSLTHQVDVLFSRYRRLSSIKDGLIECFTCGRKFPYEEIDCGHYISRTYMGLRYSEINTEPQCKSCNRFHEGVKDVFALNLQKKHGAKILQVLNNQKNTITKLTVQDLEELKIELKRKIKELE